METEIPKGFSHWFKRSIKSVDICISAIAILLVLFWVILCVAVFLGMSPVVPMKH